MLVSRSSLVAGPWTGSASQGESRNEVGAAQRHFATRAAKDGSKALCRAWPRATGQPKVVTLKDLFFGAARHKRQWMAHGAKSGWWCGENGRVSGEEWTAC